MPVFIRRWIDFERDLTREEQYYFMRDLEVIQWLTAEGYLPDQMHQEYDFRVDATQVAVEFHLPPEIETYVKLRWPKEF